MNRHDIMRISIDNTVENALKRFGIDTPRSARILMDTGMVLSKGRFSEYAFGILQNALANEDEGYFEFLRQLKSTVDEKRILDFFINLGYESWTYKAKDLRKKQEEMGKNIPWMLTKKVYKDGIIQDLRDTIETCLKYGTNSFVFLCSDIESFNRVINVVPEYKTSCFVIRSDFAFAFKCSIPSNCFLLMEKHDEKIMESFKRRELLFGLLVEKDSFDNLMPKFENFSKMGYLFIIVDGFKNSNTFKEKFIDSRYHQKLSSMFVDYQQDVLEVNRVIGKQKVYLEVNKDTVTIVRSYQEKEKEIKIKDGMTMDDIYQKCLPDLEPVNK